MAVKIEEFPDDTPIESIAEIQEFPETTGTIEGQINALRRGVKTSLAIPEIIEAVSLRDADRPTMRQERLAFERGMKDPRYMDAVANAGDDAAKLAHAEALFGPTGKLDSITLPKREYRKATIENIAKTQREIAEIPKSEAQARLSAAQSSAEKWAAWLRDPIELTSTIALESLPPSIAGAIVGSPAGPAGVAIGAGASSYLSTFSSELLGEAGKLGYNIQDPESLDKFLSNKKDFDAALKTANTKASIVGTVDTVTAGVAGKFIGPALKLGLKQRLVAAGKELLMQAAGGASGEAAGQIASGQEIDPFDIAMEAVAEVASGPAEVVSNVRGQKPKTRISIKEYAEDKPATIDVSPPSEPLPSEVEYDGGELPRYTEPSERPTGNGQIRITRTKAENPNEKQAIQKTLEPAEDKIENKNPSLEEDVAEYDRLTGAMAAIPDEQKLGEDYKQLLGQREVVKNRHGGFPPKLPQEEKASEVEVLPKVPNSIIVQTPGGNRRVTISASLNEEGRAELNRIKLINDETGSYDQFLVPSDVKNFIDLDSAAQAGFDLVRSKYKEVKSVSSPETPSEAAAAPGGKLESPPAIAEKAVAPAKPQTAVVSTGKANGAKVEIEYRIGEADDLLPYVQIKLNEAQTKQREGNIASDEQINTIATQTDPDVLFENSTSKDGRPIIDSDAALAGNARLAGMILGYRTLTASMMRYKGRVEQWAKERGEDISKIRNPIVYGLVKRYISGDRRQFVTESNPKYGTLPEPAAEQALMDAESLGAIADAQFGEDGNLTVNSLREMGNRLAQSGRITRSTKGDFDAAEVNRRVRLAALANLARQNNFSVSDLTNLIETPIGKRLVSEVIRFVPTMGKVDADLSLGSPLLASLKEVQSGILSVESGANSNLREWHQNRDRELIRENLSTLTELLVAVMVDAQTKPTMLREALANYQSIAEKEQGQRNEAAQTSDIFGEKRQNITAEDIAARLRGTPADKPQPADSGKDSPAGDKSSPVKAPVEKPGAFPKFPDLPTAVKPNGNIFTQFSELVNGWQDKVRAWLKSKPENKAIVWNESQGNFKALTRNIGGDPWRVTTYYNRDGKLMPAGHQVYKTREAAFFEEGKSPEKFFDELPLEVMTEKEIQGWKEMDDVPDKSKLVWYKLKRGADGISQLRNMLRGTAYMAAFVNDSLMDDGRVAFTSEIREKDYSYLNVEPVKSNTNFEVGETVVWKAPGTGEDVLVQWRGPLGNDQAVVIPKSGIQMTVKSDALRKISGEVERAAKPVTNKAGESLTKPILYQGEIPKQAEWKPGDSQKWLSENITDFNDAGYDVKIVGSTSDPKSGSKKDADFSVNPKSAHNVSKLIDTIAKKSVAFGKDAQDLWSFILPDKRKIELFFEGVSDEEIESGQVKKDWATELPATGHLRVGGVKNFIPDNSTPPKLRPGENQGGMEFKDEAFALAQEKGTDTDRIAAEKLKAEQSEKDRKDFAQNNEQDLPGTSGQETSSQKPPKQEVPKGAPVGTIVGGQIKYKKFETGRWYRLTDSGEKTGIALNKLQSEKMEAEAKLPPSPPETRTPAEIINQEKQVKVTLPPGATMLRVTTRYKGREIQNTPIPAIGKNGINSGNIFYDADVTKVEAGIITKDKKFQVVPGEVKAEAVKKKYETKNDISAVRSEDEPAANLGNGLPDGQGMEKSDVTEAVKGENTAGFEVKVISKDEAESITGKPEARGYGGFFYKGEVYLVAENLARGNVEGVKKLLREEIGHGLLRTQEGLAMLQTVLADGKLNLTEAEKAALREKGYQENQLLDEFIAKSAMENRSWWRQAIDRVKAWLAQRGLLKLSNGEVARMLLRQIKRAREGNELNGIRSDELPDIAPGEPVPPENLELSGEPEQKKRPRRQVFGEKVGDEYDPQSIEAARQGIRLSYFDSSGPVEAARTQVAWSAAQRMTNPEQRLRNAQEVRDVAGELGTPLLLVELRNYARKMAMAGDLSLLNFLIARHQDFELAGTQGATGSSAGTFLRGLREGADQFWRNLIELAKARSKAAGQQLRLTPEDFRAMNDALNRLELTGEQIEEILTTGKVQLPGEDFELTIEEALDQASPEAQEAARILDTYEKSQTEWLKPSGVLSTVRQIIKDALGPGPAARYQEQEAFTRFVSGRFQEATVPADIADRLAFEVWKDKQAREASATANAVERESRREARNAENLLDRLAREQTEWLKPENRNLTAETFRQWLKRTVTDASRDGFISSLRARLEEIGVPGVTAQELASQTWGKKLTLDANQRRQAWDAEQKRQQGQAERTARTFLDRYESSQTEWLKPTVKNEVLDIIKSALRSEEPNYEFRSELFTRPLAEKLIAAGVPDEVAGRLATQIYLKRANDVNLFDQKFAERAYKSYNLRSLMEAIQSAPYRAQSDPDWLKKAATDWFVSNGLRTDQAEIAATRFVGLFNDALGRSAEKIAMRFLEGKGEQTLANVVRAIRAGLTDPSRNWSDDVAALNGWKALTKEQQVKLAELEEKLSNEELSMPERAAVGEEIMTIFRQVGKEPSFMSKVSANVAASLLTGIRTFTVNVFGPLERLATERIFATVTNPAQAKTLWKGVVEAYRGWLGEAKFSLTKDAQGFLQNDFKDAGNVLKKVWEDGIRDIQSGNPLVRARGAFNLARGAQQYSMRLLNSADQANMMVEREVQLELYASTAFKAAGLKNQEIDALVTAVARMKREAMQTLIESGLDKDSARVRANEIAADAVYSFVEDKLPGEAGKVWKSAESDAYSAVGRLAPSITESDEGGLVTRSLGIPLLAASNKLRSMSGPGPAVGIWLLGFLAVPYRTTRFMAWNSPYGLIRLGINEFRKSRGWENWWKQSLATEYQERHRLKMAVAATAAQFALLGLAAYAFGSSSDDEERKKKFSIVVTGNGPRGKVLREQWTKAGYEANAIQLRVFGKTIVIPMTRVGEPLAHLFWPIAAMDDHSWRKKENLAKGNTIPEPAGASAMYAVGNYVALLGQRGILQNIGQFAKLASGDPGNEKLLASKTASIVASSAIPFLGLQNSVIGMIGGPLDRSSSQAAAAANFGVVGLPFSSRAVNRLGDELYDQSWAAKIGRTGIPVYFKVKNSPENERIYSMLVDKGAAPSELRRSDVEDKYGTISDDQFRQFALKSGSSLKRQINASMESLEKSSPEVVKQFLMKASQTANNEAGMLLNLKSVRPSARSAVPIDTSSATEVSAPASRAPVRRNIGRSSASIPRVSSISSRSRGVRRVRYTTGRIRIGRSRSRSARVRRIGRTPKIRLRRSSLYA